VAEAAQVVGREPARAAQAIEAREPDEAQAALRKHLAGTLTFVDEVRRRHPDWVIG
jgi:GntR family transcriptional regulator, rspAB operon transcriptional repressor